MNDFETHCSLSNRWAFYRGQTYKHSPVIEINTKEYQPQIPVKKPFIHLVDIAINV